MHDEINMNILLNKNVYTISFSNTFSKTILNCSNNSEKWTEYQLIMNNNNNNNNNNNESVIIKCIATPHFCHIGGSLLSYTFKYLVELLFQSRYNNCHEELADVLRGVCCKHKEIKMNKYNEMNKDHLLYYFSDKLLRANYFVSKTTTEEIATNEMFSYDSNGNIVNYTDAYQLKKKRSNNNNNRKKNKFTFRNDHDVITKRRNQHYDTRSY